MNRDPASPFVGEELFAPEPPSAAQARAGRAAAQSPFIDALLPGWADEPRSEDAFAADMAERDTLESEAPAIEQFAPQPAPSQMPAIKASPAFRIVVPSTQRLGKPLVNVRWSVHQDGTTFQGTLDNNGWTGPLSNATGSFERAKPFRLHVEGHVCCIVSGAALLVRQPEVEYGGQFVDWGLADDPDRAKRDAFWREYDLARTQRAPLDVFSFIQHDHVMRRPVKLLAGQLRAEFEARPLAIRLGPVLRYVGTRRALVWLELETPGIVRVTFGKAMRQSELPQRNDQPAARSERFASTVRVGGRHFALIWLDGLEADTAFQYRIDLAPLPAVGALPFAPGDFGPATIPTAQPAATAAGAAHATQIGLQWFFFRTATLRTDALRFAHGSCRKWPGDHDPQNRVPGPDMLEAFASHLLARPNWADWPQFFLHSGDQIYADNIGVTMGRSMRGHRFASVLPGPAPTAADDIAFGAWAGRFGQRYSVRGTGAPKASPDDVDPKYLRSFFDYRGRDRSLVDGVIDTALDTRRLADIARKAADPNRPLRHRLRVGNDLLWRVPVFERDIPKVDKVRGLRTREAFAIKHRNRAYLLEYPSAGATEGLHAGDFAEYAALYEQAWSQPATKRLLARLASFMIFDDHDVTDDWNADPLWLKVVHTDSDPLHCWPATLTDALCAYWVYQGWGNLAPEQWQTDPRVQLLERARREGRDALPALRRLVLSHSVQRTAPRANPSGKLDWHFKLPVAGIPFLAVDLRTDRDVNGKGGISPGRLRWLEQTLANTRSPVAFVVLPVPFLMPDPMLFPFRNPRFTAQLAGARSDDAFKRGSDLEHPAGNPVWDQIKGLLDRLQKSSTPLKTLVIVSGDIHFSCNLDGQLPDSRKAPRLLQLVSSGIRQSVSEEKRGQLDGAYRGWLNAVSRAQGVDEHRGVRITLGGLQGPLGNKHNFLFDTSVAVVDAKVVAHGPQLIKVPLIVQTHWASGGKGALVGYSFRHMTQSGGGALMSLNDPGFAHPTSPSDYPATTGGIGVARERGSDDEAFDSDEDSADTPLSESPDDEIEASPQLDPGETFALEDEELFAVDESRDGPAMESRIDEIDEIESDPVAAGEAQDEWEGGDGADAEDAAQEDLEGDPDGMIALEDPDFDGRKVDAELGNDDGESLPDELTEDEVLGTDERTRVTQTLQIPNRWICAIDILIDNPEWGKGGLRYISKSRATGVLIGPRHVLTARHVLDKQSHEIDGKKQAVEVKRLALSPARNGDNSKHPLGQAMSKTVHPATPYRVLRRRLVGGKMIDIPIQYRDDYALVIADKDLASASHPRLKRPLSFWGAAPGTGQLRRLDPAAIDGRQVLVSGYPGDRCGTDRIGGSAADKVKKIAQCARRRPDEWASTQWQAAGTVSADAATTDLFHTADTYQGQSGGPICLGTDGRLDLIGIHTSEHSAQRNQGVRVTRRMLREICEWMNADAGQTIATVVDDGLVVRAPPQADREDRDNRPGKSLIS